MTGTGLAAVVVGVMLACAGVARAEGDARVAVDAAAGQVLVEGVIGPRFETDVRRALSQQRHARVLVIDSPGGLRAQAFKVARLVNARGITVRVERRCASACVLLWALARSRELDAGARIGLHRSSLPTDLPLPPAMRADLMRRNDRETDAVLRAAGFPERIVALGADTPAWSMSWFSSEELQREGVPFVMREAATVAGAGVRAGAPAVAGHAPREDGNEGLGAHAP